MMAFVAHLLILQDPKFNHQNLINSLFYYSGPLHKLSVQPAHNFLSNLAYLYCLQTVRQTNQRYQKHNLLLPSR